MPDSNKQSTLKQKIWDVKKLWIFSNLSPLATPLVFVIALQTLFFAVLAA